MNRRDFSIQALSTVGLTLALPGLSLAQGAPVEGTNYVKLSQRAPTSAPAGKVEVVEFFWYGCPHCNHFEPYLAAWLSKLPADVSFRRVPVAFRENPFGIHQRMYFAVEAMGLLNTLHPKIFRAIHEDQLKLDKPELIQDFVAKQGVDAAKFKEVYGSFSVANQVRRASQLQDSYGVEGVPSMGVAGKYYTDGTMAGSMQTVLQVVEYLAATARKA